MDVEDARNKEIIQLIVGMSDIVGYVVDVEQFATVAQLKAVIGEANKLMQKTVEFFNKHKQRGTLSKHSSIRLVRCSCSQGQYLEKVFAALSPRAKEDLEGLQGAFSRFKEKFNRGIAVQAIIGIRNLELELHNLKSKLRTLGECLYVLETFIDTIPSSPRQRR